MLPETVHNIILLIKYGTKIISRVENDQESTLTRFHIEIRTESTELF